MTDTTPERQNATQAPAEVPVNVGIQQVLEAYAAELSQVTQRAIIAEAGLKAAQQQLAEAQQTIHTLSPGAPTTEEG